MSAMNFAHNGIEHAEYAETAAHGSNTVVWVIAGVAATALLLYVMKRLLGRSQTADARRKDR